MMFLKQKAGFPSERIYECHGSVHYMQCLKACTKEIWPTSEFNIPPVDESTFRACGELPKCKRCSELARPNVLMFNDWGYLGIRQAQQRQRFSQWLNKVMINQWRVVIIEIGAGKAVPTVRMTSEDMYTFSNASFNQSNDFQYHRSVIKFKCVEDDCF
jgi:NAD-dependent SIR2 family protein deacetylase